MRRADGSGKGGVTLVGSMKLYVLRHGIAEEGSPARPDPERRLTDEGERRLRAVLARAHEAGVAPEAILTSPYRRAIETAEIAREELAVNSEWIPLTALVPAASPFDLWDELGRYRKLDSLLVSGHNPLLSEFVCTLIGAREWGVAMKKAALAFLEVDPVGGDPRGSLVWLLTPKSAGASSE